MNFSSDENAYEYFSHNIGLEKYVKMVRDRISQINEEFEVLSFSMGGSAIWVLSEILCNKNISRAVCFYSSQIRYYPKIKPLIKMTLIFPKYEEHFCLQEMKNKIQDTKNVSIVQSEYLHGFMNKYSKNYNEEGYKKYLKKYFL